MIYIKNIDIEGFFDGVEFCRSIFVCIGICVRILSRIYGIV